MIMHNKMSTITKTSAQLVSFILCLTMLSTIPSEAAGKVKSGFSISGQKLLYHAETVDYALYQCAGKNTTFAFTGVGSRDRVNGKKMTVDRNGKAVFKQTLKADMLVSIHLASQNKNYYVRCLPDDFPRIDLEVKAAGKTPSGFYMLPYYSRSLEGQTFSSSYYIITDSKGTPVWYRRNSGGSTVIMSDGVGGLITQGVLNGVSPGAGRPENSIKYIKLDGSTVKDLKPSDPLVRPAFRAANGNLILLSAPRRENVDFSVLGTKFKDNSSGVCPTSRKSVSVQGLRITEMSPNGDVVWDVDLTDQIGFDEPSQASIVNIGLPGGEAECVLDLFHQNHVSMAEDGSGYVVSLRWSGVYFIDRVTKTITWKIGGTTTANSLKVQSDPLGVAGPVAQHGGVLTADNRLLVFDNQLQKHILARAVEYYIDPLSKTATHLHSFGLDASFCVTTDGTLSCPANSQGNAEYLQNGDVLVSWGNTDGRSHLATIFDPNGREIASLHSRSVKANVFSVYHAPSNAFNLNELRRQANSSDVVKNGTYK